MCIRDSRDPEQEREAPAARIGSGLALERRVQLQQAVERGVELIRTPAVRLLPELPGGVLLHLHRPCCLLHRLAAQVRVEHGDQVADAIPGSTWALLDA